MSLSFALDGSDISVCVSKVCGWCDWWLCGVFVPLARGKKIHVPCFFFSFLDWEELEEKGKDNPKMSQSPLNMIPRWRGGVPEGGVRILTSQQSSS